MRIAAVILLALIFLLLVHLVCQVKKGKTLVFVFGNGFTMANPSCGGAKVDSKVENTLDVAKETLNSTIHYTAENYKTGIEYGKKVLKGITG